MSKKDDPTPQWGYRWDSDTETVEAKLFPEGRPARGWSDTPAGCGPKK